MHTIRYRPSLALYLLLLISQNRKALKPKSLCQNQSPLLQKTFKNTNPRAGTPYIGIIGSRQVWGYTKDIGIIENHDAVRRRRDAGSRSNPMRRGFGRTPQYITRRDELSPRWVLEAIVLDRAILTQAGLWAELEPFLHRTWADGEFTFTCHGWERLMANEDDVVYKELLLEFLSTKRGCEKVSGEDMTFMWAISDPTRFLHLPFALAVSLTTRAAGTVDNIPMAGGHFITRLAISYGLIIAENVATLTPTPPARTSARYLETMGFILQPRAGVYLRAQTEEPRAPQAQPEQLARRRRRREEPAADQPQPQLSDVLTVVRELSDRVTGIEDQLVWIGEVLLDDTHTPSQLGLTMMRRVLPGHAGMIDVFSLFIFRDTVPDL
ncbi:hypothetical protein L2E82_49684 [Cichorium intybus]|uniref:Uncharacterized protein n=1 Tax=Cichorium intybus TaxID=13427 RepID=A0ACB8Z1V2_CICIN|nr:hypothetical protein L2E82_49684 [Cichorium intybus]